MTKTNLIKNKEELSDHLYHYGLMFNHAEKKIVTFPKILPEQLIIYLLKHTTDLLESKIFIKIIDWLFLYHDLLRPDVFLKEFKILDEKDRKILCGILEITNHRKFKMVINKIKYNFTSEIFICSPKQKIRLFGDDPIMKKYGIVCTFIHRSRMNEESLKDIAFLSRCEILKNRILIGPNARADFISFRKFYPNENISKIRNLTHTSKTSSVIYEKNLKVLLSLS